MSSEKRRINGLKVNGSGLRIEQAEDPNLERRCWNKLHTNLHVSEYQIESETLERDSGGRRWINLVRERERVRSEER